MGLVLTSLLYCPEPVVYQYQVVWKSRRGMLSPTKLGQNLSTACSMEVEAPSWPGSGTGVSLIRHQGKRCVNEVQREKSSSGVVEAKQSIKCGRFYSPEAGCIFSQKGHCDKTNKQKTHLGKKTPFQGFVCLKNKIKSLSQLRPAGASLAGAMVRHGRFSHGCLGRNFRRD